jgi:tetratricopeptide (TPR) repeat protein
LPQGKIGTFMLSVRAFVLICMLTFLVTPPGLPQTSGDSSVALQKAAQLTREHQYAEAEAALKNVQPPTNPTQRIAFYRLKAAIASGLGHFTAATQFMDTAAALAPGNHDLRLAADIARLQQQIAGKENPSTTLRRLRNQDLSPPQALAIRLQLAQILSSANLFSEASVDFAAASALAPDRPDLLYDLALSQFRSGDLNAAAASAERAKTLGDNGAVENLLGDIQEKKGDSLAAVHSYQEAVNLEPNEERYRVALALELLRHQTFDAALVVLNQASTLFPKSLHIQILLALTYYFVDRSADAIQTLLHASELDPQDETAAHYLGELTLQDTSTPDPAATKQVCAFADQHAQDKLADAFCGGILLRSATESGDPSQRAEILRRLQHAARLAPKEPTARCQLGKAFEWSDRWVEAKLEMEACVRLDPDSPDGHYQLARIYRHLGQPQLADRQTALQKAAANRQSEESNRRAELIEKFKVTSEQ